METSKDNQEAICMDIKKAGLPDEDALDHAEDMDHLSVTNYDFGQIPQNIKIEDERSNLCESMPKIESSSTKTYEHSNNQNYDRIAASENSSILDHNILAEDCSQKNWNANSSYFLTENALQLGEQDNQCQDLVIKKEHSENITETNLLSTSQDSNSGCFSLNEALNVSNLVKCSSDIQTEQLKENETFQGTIRSDESGSDQNDEEFCDMSDLAFVTSVVLENQTEMLQERQKTVSPISAVDELISNAAKKLCKRLVPYDSLSSGTEDSDSESTTSDSSSTSTTTDSTSSESDEEIAKIRQLVLDAEFEEHDLNCNAPKTKDEVLPQELPEEAETHVEIPPNARLERIGEVQSFVELMLVIKGLKDTPALDIDTILFKEDRTPFGKVFDVFGPVQNPFYTIRFQNEEKFHETKLAVGDVIYFAPNYLNLTNYVFLEQLKKMKGSDASWYHDQEPPAECVEYSDDEEEAKAKSAAKRKRQHKRQNIKLEDGNDADCEGESEKGVHLLEEKKWRKGNVYSHARRIDKSSFGNDKHNFDVNSSNKMQMPTTSHSQPQMPRQRGQMPREMFARAPSQPGGAPRRPFFGGHIKRGSFHPPQSGQLVGQNCNFPAAFSNGTPRNGFESLRGEMPGHPPPEYQQTTHSPHGPFRHVVPPATNNYNVQTTRHRMPLGRESAMPRFDPTIPPPMLPHMGPPLLPTMPPTIAPPTPSSAASNFSMSVPPPPPPAVPQNAAPQNGFRDNAPPFSWPPPR